MDSQALYRTCEGGWRCGRSFSVPVIVFPSPASFTRGGVCFSTPSSTLMSACTTAVSIPALQLCPSHSQSRAQARDGRKEDNELRIFILAAPSLKNRLWLACPQPEFKAFSHQPPCMTLTFVVLATTPIPCLATIPKCNNISCLATILASCYFWYAMCFLHCQTLSSWASGGWLGPLGEAEEEGRKVFTVIHLRVWTCPCP